MARSKNESLMNKRLDAAYDALLDAGRPLDLTELRDATQLILRRNNEIKQLTDNSLYAFLSTAKLQNHPSFSVNGSRYSLPSTSKRPSEIASHKSNDLSVADYGAMESQLKARLSALQKENEELKRTVAELYLELRRKE